MEKAKYGKMVIRIEMIKMAKLTVLIKNELDEKFRETVFKTKGMHRGNITEAIEEAIELWIRDETRKEKGKSEE